MIYKMQQKKCNYNNVFLPRLLARFSLISLSEFPEPPLSSISWRPAGERVISDRRGNEVKEGIALDVEGISALSLLNAITSTRSWFNRPCWGK